MSCGHIATCPVCSRKLRKARAEKIERAIDKSGGRWQMLTLTIAHRAGMPLKGLVDGLMLSYRKARQGGWLQRIMKQRVSASVRALEVTYGANGWHPHIHVLMRTSEWCEAETDELFRRFSEQVSRHLGVECVPSRERGVWWSDAFTSSKAGACYLAKLGLEVVGEGKLSHRSHWAVAMRAAAGDARAVKLWREYGEAMKGKRIIELDDRAQAYADAPIDAGEHVATRALDRTVEIHVWREELYAIRALEKREPATIGALLARVRTTDDPEREVKAWIERACGVALEDFRKRWPERQSEAIDTS